MEEQFLQWLAGFGIDADDGKILWTALLVISVSLLGIVIDWFTKKALLRTLKLYSAKSKAKWDDVLVEKKVFDHLSHLVPASLIFWATPVVFKDYPSMIDPLLKVVDVGFVLIITMFLVSLLNAMVSIFKNAPGLKGKPIEGYFQLAKIITYIISGILILSLLLNRSPLYFLSAFGAMTAIILLIFKDTILGFVASIQISANDMVREGDWITMKKFDTDGDVMNITLNTVKVRNFDQTISTVPTYAFISESFVNWRGMQEKGGRRIKRSLLIRQNSVRFCDDQLLEKLKKLDLIQSYIEEKQAEIREFNEGKKVDKSLASNGRNLTNLGIFRVYVEEYLKQHSGIHQSMTLMARQLSPSSQGLPLEIYCFTNTVAWSAYENIQSDIFDHLIAAIREFELELFEFESAAVQ